MRIQIAGLLLLTAACGPMPEVALTSVPVVASTPVPTKQPQLVNNVTPIPLTYYTRTRVETVAGYKHVTLTAHCVVYLENTYCWDDGIKTVDLNGDSRFISTYTYWNQGIDRGDPSYFGSGREWSYVLGQVLEDLMPQPTLITFQLKNSISTGGSTAPTVAQVLTTGTPANVECTDNLGVLDCVDFVIDLNQEPLI